MERFHGHSDEPQKDLNSSKDFLQDPSIDVQFVDKENVYNLNESLFRTMCGDDLEECRSLIDEEPDQGGSSTLAWS